MFSYQHVEEFPEIPINSNSILENVDNVAVQIINSELEKDWGFDFELHGFYYSSQTEDSTVDEEGVLSHYFLPVYRVNSVKLLLDEKDKDISSSLIKKIKSGEATKSATVGGGLGLLAGGLGGAVVGAGLGATMKALEKGAIFTINLNEGIELTVKSTGSLYEYMLLRAAFPEELPPNTATSILQIDEGTPKTKRWYQSVWLLFWLLIAWPVGLFGLLALIFKGYRNASIALGVVIVLLLANKYFNFESIPPGFTERDLCKAGISTAFSKKISIIKHRHEKEGVHYLHYRRPEDNKRWDYRCKISGNKIILASSNGRWRDSYGSPWYDSKLTFSFANDQFVVTESYSDGSEIRKSF